MLETPHVAVAAAIAYKIPNPLIALPLALGSHFILELVPHWNPHLNTEMKKHGKVTALSTKIVIVDAALALAVGFFLAGKTLPDSAHFLTMLFSCLLGVLPDLIEAPYYFFKIKSKFIQKAWIPFQKSIQFDAPIIPGLSTQILTVIASIWWVLG